MSQYKCGCTYFTAHPNPVCPKHGEPFVKRQGRACNGDPDTIVPAPGPHKKRPTAQPADPKEAQNFRKELESLLNKYCKENGSDTPDFILAEYLFATLEIFDTAVSARERWYGMATGEINAAVPTTSSR